MLCIVVTLREDWEDLKLCSYEVTNLHLKYRVFFLTGPPLKKTKSKIMLEYPDWASPGPRQKVKVHGLGLP